MVNGIRIIYLDGLNKEFGLKFHVDFQVRKDTSEEGRKKICCEYYNKDEDNSVNTLIYKKNW